MKRLRYLLGFALVVVGCTDDLKPECVEICAAADHCRMLPSPLGIADTEGLIKYTALDNCEHRCANSSGRTIQQLAACIEKVGVGTSTDDAWCNGGCSDVGNCFEQVFEDPRITGTGRVQVEFANFDGAAIPPAFNCGDDITDSTEITETTELTSTDLCSPENGEYVIESVELLLENNEYSQVLTRGTCSEVLAASFLSDLVPTGRYQLAIRLFRSPVSTTPGETPSGDCHKFYGDIVHVSAGAELCEDSSCTGTMLLPATVTEFESEPACASVEPSAGVPCEKKPDDCKDTDDNDCDGLNDCDDPSCATQCTESGAYCGDDEDNDNDGLIDCEDSDCDDAAACTTTTTAADMSVETETGGDTGTG